MFFIILFDPQTEHGQVVVWLSTASMFLYLGGQCLYDLLRILICGMA